MSTDAPANMFDGELAALRRRRELESLCTSPVTSILSNLAEVADEFGVPGAGLFARALKSGQTPVEKVLEQVEIGAYVEINRIWKHLDGQDERWKEFDARLKNQEAQSAYVAAILHGLRTSDPQKQSRIGALTISCLYANDTEPEVLDDMMRAVIELRDADLAMLRMLYTLWKPLLDRTGSAGRDIRMLPPNFHSEFQNVWHSFGRSLNPSEQFEYRGTFARLQSHGMIQQVTFSNTEVGREPYVLLKEGAKFYERLQEIGAAT